MLTRAQLLLVLALPTTACFGEGPIPTPPSGAQILFVVPPPPSSTGSCPTGTYVGDVTLGADNLYAVTLPFVPTSDSCNNGDGGGGSGGDIRAPSLEVPVYRIPKLGGAVAMIGVAGQSDGTAPPMLSAAGDNITWVATGTPISGLTIGGSPSITATSFAMNTLRPAGIIDDGAKLFVAATNFVTTGKAEPNHPDYPCCGPASAGSGQTVFAALPALGGSPTTLPIAPLFSCETAAQCLVSTSTLLVYLAKEAASSGWYVGAFPKAATTAAAATVLAMIGSQADKVPVGLAATETTVVWAIAPSYNSTPFSPPRCEIHSYDLATATEKTLLISTAFSCMGAAIDDTSVYFAIVDVSTRNQHMYGKGIGRVGLADRNLETLSIHIEGDGAGVRRILLDGEDMVVVDPFTIARIAKTALADQHDLEL